jgi:hypothetical protein
LLCAVFGLANPVAAETVAQASPGAAGPSRERVATDMTRKLFISGHSLTNARTAGFLAEIAKAAGFDLSWNLQYMEGSSIQNRRYGHGQKAAGAEYRQGFDRSGRPSDVLAELAPPAKGENPYDTLVVTEQHGLLGSLVWQDTILNLRHLHDLYMRGNPQGRTILYEPWLSIDDKSAPARWIAYERAAAPVWQCIATRVNRGLELEGRADRLVSMPMGLALALVVEQATGRPGLAGITQASTRATLDLLFADDVHPTLLGDYYVAAVMFGYLFDQSPVGRWAPGEIDPIQAGSLQRVADQAIRDHRLARPALTLAQCRDYLTSRFVDDYLDYFSRIVWKPELGTLRAALKKWQLAPQWRRLFGEMTPDNPFGEPVRGESGARPTPSISR